LGPCVRAGQRRLVTRGARRGLPLLAPFFLPTPTPSNACRKRSTTATLAIPNSSPPAPQLQLVTRNPDPCTCVLYVLPEPVAPYASTPQSQLVCAMKSSTAGCTAVA